ncbi:MAG TPA: DUF3224 domain-containing protein [Pyrinomonadaceae bacterium]|nr:DUF3224 domain-containing protein [Pyrinomonadaceae bacterium]
MKILASIALTVFTFAVFVLGESAMAQSSGLAGDWTGESICVGEIGACHDEQVVYHVSVDGTDATRVKIGADKIVDGRPDFMGDIFLKYDAAKNTLIGNLESPRGRGVWEFTVKGNMMWGTLSQLPEKRIVRQIRVTKNQLTTTMTAMTNHATGTFEVKLTPQNDQPADPSMGRMTFDKQWSGDITGASKGQMLTGGDVKTGSAGYVAIEKFTGSVKGHKGSLIFQHSATMTAGQGDLTITVVPNSGTEELKGINGKLTIKIEGGKHFYDFEYSLP